MLRVVLVLVDTRYLSSAVQTRGRSHPGTLTLAHELSSLLDRPEVRDGSHTQNTKHTHMSPTTPNGVGSGLLGRVGRFWDLEPPPARRPRRRRRPQAGPRDVRSAAVAAIPDPRRPPPSPPSPPRAPLAAAAATAPPCCARAIWPQGPQACRARATCRKARANPAASPPSIASRSAASLSSPSARPPAPPCT